MTDYATWTDEQADSATMQRLYGWSAIRTSKQDSNRIAGVDPAEPDCRSTTARPTQDAQAMLDVIGAMGKRGWCVTLRGPRWNCRFERGHQSVMAHALMAQRAVVIAALLAIDTEKGTP